MRILNLSGAVPAVSADGSAATFATLRALAGLGHAIDYVYLRSLHTAPDDAVQEEWLSSSGQRLAATPMGNPRLDAWYGRLHTARWHPGLAARYAWSKVRGEHHQCEAIFRLAMLSLPFRRSVLDGIKARLARGAYDVVQVDYPWLVNLGRLLTTPLPTVFVAHELQSQIVEQLTSDRVLSAEVRQTEAARLRAFDAVIVLSPEDEACVRDMNVPHVYYAPLAIGTVTVSPSQVDALRRPLTLTFLGSYQHVPNQDAVAWLCADVMPAIRARVPDARLSIIGRYPPHFVERFRADTVRFEGFVGDLRAALAGTVFVCPIRVGSGMRVKILDAIACGAPVIATRLGARGLGLIEEETFLPADTPEDFANQTLRVATDGALRERVIQGSLVQFAARFSPEAVARRRTDVLEAIIADHGTRSR